MAQPKLRWKKIDENLKVAKWTSQTGQDIRTFNLRGYRLSAELLDIDPRTGKRLKQSEWFVYARKY
jgi:hypothetical protein